MTKGREPLPEKWRRFRMRPPEDRTLILHAALILPLTEIGLRLLGFRRWKGLIERISPPAPLAQSLPADVQRERALRAVRAVHSVELHGPANPNCLERSMTLWWMLRRDGVEGELHIGARKQGVRFEAHAWVELGGKVLNDSGEVHQHYARFDAPIAAASMAESHAPGMADSNAVGKADSDRARLWTS
jgi:hypothetical protein